MAQGVNYITWNGYDAQGGILPEGWYRLVAVQGAVGADVATLVGKGDGKGWPWLSFYAPEQWAALVNDAGNGVGLYQPDTARIPAFVPILCPMTFSPKTEPH